MAHRSPYNTGPYNPHQYNPNNQQLVLANVPPPAPPAGAPAHDVHIEGEKKEQKAIQRRTVDILGPYLHWLDGRRVHWDQHRFKGMLPTAAAAGKILPPVGYLSQPATSYTNKFVNLSVNKVRCSIDSVVWSPDGKRCLTGSHRGEFTFWNGNTFKYEGVLQAHRGAITCMKYTHNENWLVTCDAVGHVIFLKNTNVIHNDFEAHKDSIRGITFAPSDVKFATASGDSTIKIWDFRTCQEDRVLSGHARDVLSCDWHPSMSALVSSSRDYTIRLWDPRVGGEALSSLEGHMNEVTTVQWHVNGNSLLSAGKDNQLKIWDTRMMSELHNFAGSQAPVNCASWHPIHEDVFVSGSHDGNILFWLASRPNPQAEIIGAHEAAVWSLAWNPTGHLLCTGGGDHCSRFWCRARPGDPWRDRSRSQEAGFSLATGSAVARQPASFAAASTAIPGISDMAPGLAPSRPLANPNIQGGHFPAGRPRFPGGRGMAPRPPPGPPPPGPPPQGAGEKRRLDEKGLKGAPAVRPRRS